jgi:hypothetical protein
MITKGTDMGKHRKQETSYSSFTQQTLYVYKISLISKVAPCGELALEEATDLL